MEESSWNNIENIRKTKKKKKANSTWNSQAVTHPSTIHAQHNLTLVIRREPVDLVWYGRWL